MANIETVGVKLVVEGFGGFQRQMGRVDTELKRKQKDAGGAAGAIGGLGTAFGGVLGPLGMFAGALANVAQIAAGIIAARLFETLTTGLFSIGKQALLAAGRVEELGLITRHMGEQAEYSGDQIEKWAKRLRGMGIRTDEAYRLIALFIRQGLDLAKMWDLVSVAQGGATLTGEDTTQSLMAMIGGIVSLQPRVLKTRGIIVNLNRAYATHAALIGKVVSDLTEQEQVTALLNATLHAGVSVAGLYEVAMQSWSKQLRSTPRYVYELLRELGTPFNQVMQQAVFSMNEFIQTLTGAISAGGWLRPIIDSLANALVRLVAPIVAFVNWLSAAIVAQQSFVQRFESGIDRIQQKWDQFTQRYVSATEDAVSTATSGLSEIANKTGTILADVGRNITRMWDDFGRRLARSTEDWGRRQTRDEEDWNRDQQRNLEDHLRRLAEMRESWDEKDYRRRVRQVRRDAQKWAFFYGRDLADYNAMLAGAKTEEERIRIQSWIDQLNVEDEGHREEAQDELDALAQEKLDHERRIAMEKEEFARRRALADEDRRIRQAREEEDRQIRLAREQADAELRQQRLEDDAARRIALLAEEAEEQDTWADDMAGRMGGMTSAIEGFSGTMVTAVDKWVEKFEGFGETIADIDWNAFATDLSTIADAAGWLRDTFSSLGEKFTTAATKLDEFGDPLLALGLIVEGNIEWLRKWGEVLAGVVDVIAIAIREGPRAAITALIDYLPEWGRALWAALIGFSKIIEGFTGLMAETVLSAIDWLVFFISGEMPGLKKRFQGWFYGLGESIMAGIIDGVRDMASHLMDWIERIVGNAYDWAKRILGIASPSTAFYNLGQEMVRGLTEGLKSLEAMPAIQVAHMATGAMQAVGGTSTMTNNYNLTVNTTAPSEPIIHDYYLMRARTG